MQKKALSRKPLLQQKKIKSIDIAKQIDEFISQLTSLKSSLPLTMAALLRELELSVEDLNGFLDECGKRQNKTDLFTIGSQHVTAHRKLRLRYENTENAYLTLPNSFLITLVSKFDAFLGNMIRSGLLAKPEIIKNNEHNFSLSSFQGFESIEEAEQAILDSEIESLLSNKNPRSEQIKWFSQLLNVDIKKIMKDYPNFIEACERRNLYVHSDGIISPKYLLICKNNGVKIDKKHKVGNKFVDCPGCHFRNALENFFEAGIIISQLMWRYLFPSDLIIADSHLIETCFNLVQQKQYKLAERLLDFAINNIRISDQEHMRYFIINKCIVLKELGKNAEMKKCIASHDWTSCSLEFELALAVLKKEYDNAALVMEKIGKKHKTIDATAYADWPLFSDFRKTIQFSKTYKKIFGNEFVITGYLPKRLKETHDTKSLRAEIEKMKINKDSKKK